MEQRKHTLFHKRGSDEACFTDTDGCRFFPASATSKVCVLSGKVCVLANVAVAHAASWRVKNFSTWPIIKLRFNEMNCSGTCEIALEIELATPSCYDPRFSRRRQPASINNMLVFVISILKFSNFLLDDPFNCIS